MRCTPAQFLQQHQLPRQILLYGLNEDLIFLLAHTYEKRLQHSVHWMSESVFLQEGEILLTPNLFEESCPRLIFITDFSEKSFLS